MKTVGVVPARYASTRFPGKPLALIAGQPMIVRVWERARRASSLDQLVVATDDDRIAGVCRDAGIDVLMTSSSHDTGTDRIAEVSALVKADVFVNVQGDEPLLDPASIDDCVECLVGAASRGIEVATVYVDATASEQIESPSSVCLVPSVDGCVLSLSRLPIPCEFRVPYAHKIHVGLFAFTAAALARFAARQPGPVERSESIELLRFLEYGDRIACRQIGAGPIGVDRPEDIVRVEAILASAAEGRA